MLAALTLMNRTWLLTILAISCILLATLKQYELSSLKPFFKAERTIKLARFAEAKKNLNLPDQELLELWESMLTGRSAPLNKWMKDQYRVLGLNHLFTPSGFHLSSILTPLARVLKGLRWQLIILLVVGLGLCWVPGMGALKRMVWIKAAQSLCGLKIGFVLALLVDCLFGSFQDGALSFTYSFLFLGIIYSGAKGAGLAMWFFLAQMILAHFQGNNISPLLMVISPLLNFAFALVMPLLLILAIPLCQWQLLTGLWFLSGLQKLVSLAAHFITFVPTLEINVMMLVLVFAMLWRKTKLALAGILFFSGSLNLDLQKNPSLGTYDFVPQGNFIRTISKNSEDVIYFSDGKCNRKLVRGLWWETCSPAKRSMRKKLMKLSYPSSRQQRSSLRG